MGLVARHVAVDACPNAPTCRHLLTATVTRMRDRRKGIRKTTAGYRGRMALGRAMASRPARRAL